MKEIVLAYLCTTLGGWLVVGIIVFLMRRTTGKSKDVKFLEWGPFWIGCAERAIATTLVIGTPKFVPAFIGGWFALKMVAGWSRHKEAEHTTGHLFALVGTALSFAVAIGVGLGINPGAVDIWNEQ